MGAWGTDHFANDDAMEWIGDLESVTDASVLRAAFEPVLGAGDYIDAPVGSVTLAAAEVVAALRGSPHAGLPPAVVEWVEAFGVFDEPSLLDDARKAVRIVGEDGERSELWQLWDEAAPEDSGAWRREVADLQARLT
jgi:uncharacterized protein DUF4259